jgi:hypothetical protein
MVSRGRLDEHYSQLATTFTRIALFIFDANQTLCHRNGCLLWQVGNCLPGVIGGVADRHSMPAERSSEKTSPSQPCFTPSIPSPGKNRLIGVGSTSQTEGGLLMLLPLDDRGGVAGAYEKSVSIGRR